MIPNFLFLTVTYSAGVLVTIIVTALSIISFVIHKHTKRIPALLVSVLGTTATVLIMKVAFGFSRPEASFYLEDGYTFPSWHAAIAVALYGFLFMTVLEHDRHHLKNKSLLLLALLILGVGFSRIYLGVHYTEDVLAGYAIGIFWLFLSTKLHKYLHSKR